MSHGDVVHLLGLGEPAPSDAVFRFGFSFVSGGKQHVAAVVQFCPPPAGSALSPGCTVLLVPLAALRLGPSPDAASSTLAESSSEHLRLLNAVLAEVSGPKLCACRTHDHARKSEVPAPFNTSRQSTVVAARQAHCGPAARVRAASTYAHELGTCGRYFLPARAMPKPGSRCDEAQQRWEPLLWRLRSQYVAERTWLSRRSFQ